MAEKKLTNEKAARHIWNNALQRSFQPFSWGLDFSSIKTIENGTAFHVKAAWVHIQYLTMTDKFRVSLIPDDKERKPIIYEPLMLDRLVSVIDDTVKHGTLSDNPVCHEYGLTSERIAV